MTIFENDRQLLDDFRAGKAEALTRVYRAYVDALGRPAPLLDILEIARACGIPKIYHLPSGSSDDQIKDMLKIGLSDRELCMLLLDVE